MKKEQGITLIALIITIIVLLILAAISIATLTGENGILTKASEAEKRTDITETKEKIKLEIMGNYNENKTKYTNSDVINAVEKITGKEIAENTATVQSKKGNEVDISDLWRVAKEIQFTLEGVSLVAYEDETWYQWATRNQELIQNTTFGVDPETGILHEVNEATTDSIIKFMFSEYLKESGSMAIWDAWNDVRMDICIEGERMPSQFEDKILERNYLVR